MVMVVLFTIVSMLNTPSVVDDSGDNAAKVTERLITLYQEFEGGSGRIGNVLEEERLNVKAIHDAMKNDYGISWLVFHNGELRYWSDNTTVSPQDLTGLQFSSGKEMLNLGPRSYIPFRKEKGDHLIIALLLIEQHYPFTNKYLKYNINQCLGVSDGYRIGTPSDIGSAVHAPDGTVLFTISTLPESQTHHSPWRTLVYMVLLLIAGVALYQFLRLRSGSHILPACLVSVSLIFLAALIRNDVFRLFDNSRLFSPGLYASGELLNSFGEFIILAVIIALVVNVIVVKFNEKGFTSLRWKAPVLSALLITTGIYLNLIIHLVDGLILNSRIPFDINHAFSLDIYTLLGYLVIALLVHSLFAFSLIIWEQFRGSSVGKKETFKYILVFITGLWLGSFIFLELFERMVSVWSLLLLVSGLSAGVIISTIVRSRQGILNILSRAVIYSLMTTILVLPAVQDKESESVKLYTSRLENERDLVAEYLAGDVVSEISADDELKSLFSLSPDSIISLYSDKDIAAGIVGQYFASGYWSRYDILIRSFYKSYLPLNTAGDPSWDSQYFEALIETSSPTLTEDLFFTGTENEKYIARLRIDTLSGSPNVIYMIFREKLGRSVSGFPALLLSGNVIDEQEQSSDYSYAIYEGERLIRNSGRFRYRNTLSGSFTMVPDTSSEIAEGEFIHTFGMSEDKTVVVTRSSRGFVGIVTFFAYAFWLYVVVILLYYVVTRVFSPDIQKAFDYKTRIQLTIISVVVAAFFIIGVSSVVLFRENFSNSTLQQADSKLSLLKPMLNDELARRSLNSLAVTDDMYGRLAELSGLIDNDFNLFGTDGSLKFSSQPKIYEYGLIGSYMDPSAYRNLSANGDVSFKQYERIGELEYLSAYEPVRNDELSVIGYINLPFFAKEEQLRADIAGFLIAMINIYVLLLLLAVLIAVLISNRITKPLQLIQGMMSNLTYGPGNEHIEWKNEDEIGKLIKQYNLMVDELEVSAKKLAATERETAWREMAKQVAHEIKNPLTPMKLNIQQLQRKWKEGGEDLGEMTEKLSATLIEQIDVLANIATEFANFAKMPAANMERLDLMKVINASAELYRNESDSEIRVVDNSGGRCHLNADHDQMVRVFSNLLKNAIQSIPAERKGDIMISLTRADDVIEIIVSDNGSGIPAEIRPRIFTPNFTTKSSGTGLGLAIVKNIIDNSGGTIRFESTEGSGTSFFITLPAADL